MDFEKLTACATALHAALASIEKAMEIRQQTSRVRNLINSNDLDLATTNSILAIRMVNAEMAKLLKDE
jgi:hypothetical protein